MQKSFRHILSGPLLEGKLEGGGVNIHLAVQLDELLLKLVVMLQLYVQYCLANYLLTCSLILAQLNKHKQQKMKFSRLSWIMDRFIVTFTFISSIKEIFHLRKMYITLIFDPFCYLT